MNPRSRPHVLGVDDAPFDKRQNGPVPIIAVAIAGLRARPMLQAVILGGITIAGLGIIDVTTLAE